jgi:hypothetical protein
VLQLLHGLHLGEDELLRFAVELATHDLDGDLLARLHVDSELDLAAAAAAQCAQNLVLS